MKYVVTDAEGRPLGFYDHEVHGPRMIGKVPNKSTKIPANAIEIPDELWQQWIQDTAGQVLQGTQLIKMPPKAPPATWDQLRLRRNRLLSDSDWTQVRDAPLDAAKVSAWSTYRTALRNLPQTYPDASTVVWPTPPA